MMLNDDKKIIQYHEDGSGSRLDSSYSMRMLCPKLYPFALLRSP